jgi:hypothetical protein
VDYEEQKKLLKRAAAIPLKLIYESLPKEHLELFLPYVVIPSKQKNPPFTIYLLRPEELNIPRQKIWPDKIYRDNESFMISAMQDGRKSDAVIYEEVKRFNERGQEKEPISIEIYPVTYGEYRKQKHYSDESEYRGVDDLYPMLIYCKQRNGQCFLVISADYKRNPYLDFKAIRWKESLRSISVADFWDYLTGPKQEIFDLDITYFRSLRQKANFILKKEFEGSFGAHHMNGGRQPHDEDYGDERIKTALEKDEEWKGFLQAYNGAISGVIDDWERPPIRSLLDTSENRGGSNDLNTFLDVYCKKEFPEKLFIMNCIPEEYGYGYMWFNIPALLKGMQLFMKNNDNYSLHKEVKFLLSLNAVNDESWKGAIVKLYQVDEESNPAKITKGSSIYGYNEAFPYPKRTPTTWGHLKNAFNYFFNAGTKLLVYRAYDINARKYQHSIIQLEAIDEAKVLHYKLSSRGIIDATLCLFIPAEEKSDYQYKNDEFKVWLVSDTSTLDPDFIKKVL